MKIIQYCEDENINDSLKSDEPLIAVISFDSQKAIVALLSEAVEHNILLAKNDIKSTDIDKYFRIIFDRDSADWTFVCPPDYKNITDKTKRIAEFYKDGFAAISKFLAEIGFFVDINIPKRYRRHLNFLS